MAKKLQLRQTRAGTVINVTSAKQESDIYQALLVVIADLRNKHGLYLHHDPYWHLKYIVENCEKIIPKMISAITLTHQVSGQMAAYCHCSTVTAINILFLFLKLRIRVRTI